MPLLFVSNNESQPRIGQTIEIKLGEEIHPCIITGQETDTVFIARDSVTEKRVLIYL